MSILDKDFKEPSRWPWPVWPIAIVLAFGVGTCRAHQTAASPPTTTTIPTSTTTTAPVPRLITEPGLWDIVAPCYLGPEDRAASSCSGTMFADNTNPTPNDFNLSFWCGGPASTGVEITEAPDPSLPDGGLPAFGHECTWPEMKAQGWRAVKQEKPSHSFWCGDHACTPAELKKAKFYEASLHPLVTP